jgi:hypothetical protein
MNLESAIRRNYISQIELGAIDAAEEFSGLNCREALAMFKVLYQLASDPEIKFEDLYRVPTAIAAGLEAQRAVMFDRSEA